MTSITVAISISKVSGIAGDAPAPTCDLLLLMDGDPLELEDGDSLCLDE